MLLDRTAIRETGSSDQTTTRPSDDFDGVTRSSAMKQLLDKHDELERNPAHRFWAKRHTISGRQVMAQREHAARVWERLHPGKPAHFEVDGDALEQRLFKHYAPWRLRLRWWFSRVLATMFLVLVAVNAHAQTRQQVAADIMRRLNTPANLTMHPPCTDCDGPRIYIMGSTPGAASWLDFPPEREHLRLDGTPLSQPPTVYGGVNAYWFPTIDSRPADRRGVQQHVPRSHR